MPAGIPPFGSAPPVPDNLPSMTVIVHAVEEDAIRTQVINSTSYVGNAIREIPLWWGGRIWTHFYMVCFGNTSEVGQSITLQLSVDAGGFPKMGILGNDLVLTGNVAGWWESGWRVVDRQNTYLLAAAAAARLGAGTGILRNIIAVKGSNGTVDFALNHLSMVFKYDPYARDLAEFI